MASADFTTSSADNYGALTSQNFGSIVNHFNVRPENPASQLPRPSPPSSSAVNPFRRDRDFVERDVLNDIWDPFVVEEIPIGTAFKLEYDEGAYAETQLAFSEGEVINSATNKCQGRTCTKDHDDSDSVSDFPMKAVYVCEECEGATYCKRCALENLADPQDYHKANHQLRCWRPIRVFRTPTSIVELDPDTTVVSPESAEKAVAEYKRLARRQQRSSVMRLFLPAPKLDPLVHNCTKLKLHFCLDYLPIKYTNIWTMDKTVKMPMKKAGVVKVLVKRISLPTAPWDIFHPSNGYSEHWEKTVKPKEENQPHIVDMRIPPAANSTKHDAAIEVAIHFVQDLTNVLPSGKLLAPYQFKLRFDSATMSTKDKIVQFVSRGEVLQVQKSEQNGDTSLQGWELVHDDDWDFDAEDHQALGRKGRTVGDLINDIRWFWGRDPILDDSGES